MPGNTMASQAPLVYPIKEFVYSLKCLLRVGYPEGINLCDLEGLYSHFTKKTITPSSIFRSARGWEDVFQILPELQLTFEVTKDADGLFSFVKLRRDGNETRVDEVEIMMKLLSYENYVHQKQTSRPAT